jgi:enolase
MIENIILSEIYNSCKEKAIKVSMKTGKGVFSSTPPSGTSKGSYEAKTLDIEKIKKHFPKIKKKFI